MEVYANIHCFFIGVPEYVIYIVAGVVGAIILLFIVVLIIVCCCVCRDRGSGSDKKNYDFKNKK